VLVVACPLALAAAVDRIVDHAVARQRAVAEDVENERHADARGVLEARAHAASRAEILDLTLLACAAVVVVAAHRDAARARVALDHELHDRSGLAELGAVCVVREELLGREDAVWPDDARILARIEDHLAETVGDVGGLEVSALQEL